MFLVRVSTMRKRNGWRGPYELLSGTRVVQSKPPLPPLTPLHSAAERPPQRSHSPTPGRVQGLGLVGRTRSGAAVPRARRELERSVWIQSRTSAPSTGSGGFAVAPARLRWLGLRAARRIQPTCSSRRAVCGLSDLAQRSDAIEVAMAERALASLAEELAQCEAESGCPSSVTQPLWIDRNWNVRLLDETRSARRALLGSTELLGARARALLSVGPQRELPPDLPDARRAPRACADRDGPSRSRTWRAARSALARSQAAARTSSAGRARPAGRQHAPDLDLRGLSFVIYLIIWTSSRTRSRCTRRSDELQKAAPWCGRRREPGEMKKQPRGRPGREGRHVRAGLLSLRAEPRLRPEHGGWYSPQQRELCTGAARVPNPRKRRWRAMAKIREQRGGRIDNKTPFSQYGVDKVSALSSARARWSGRSLP
jgi:hypothetical protein